MIGKLIVSALEAIHLRMPRAKGGEKLQFQVSDRGFIDCQIEGGQFYYSDLTGNSFAGTAITKSDFRGSYVIGQNVSTGRKTLVTGPFLKHYLVEVCGAKVDEETLF